MMMIIIIYSEAAHDTATTITQYYCALYFQHLGITRLKQRNNLMSF